MSKYAIQYIDQFLLKITKSLSAIQRAASYQNDSIKKQVWQQDGFDGLHILWNVNLRPFNQTSSYL